MASPFDPTEYGTALHPHHRNRTKKPRYDRMREKDMQYEDHLSALTRAEQQRKARAKAEAEYQNAIAPNAWDANLESIMD
jgi:hypothetical protein